MKETNSVEMQLRSWELRAPSAGLKRRIFRSRNPQPVAGLAFRWLAPAAACLLLAVTFSHQEGGLSTRTARQEPILAMIRSNQTPVADFATNPARAGSNLATVGFEWTNRSDSTSSVHSFLPAQ
jgi:hypothetical protein